MKQAELKVGVKLKINKNIPSVNGMLYENTVIKLDEVEENEKLRVVDDLGRVWYVTFNDVSYI